MPSPPARRRHAVDALPGLLRAAKDDQGERRGPVNALLGAANLILREVEIHQPRAVVLCFGPDAASYRTELYPAYHADREEEMPDELAPQFAAAHDFFEAFGWTVATSDSLEADDLLGTYARREAEAGGHALLLTGDRDMYQCAASGSRCSTCGPAAKAPRRSAPAEVRERYGIDPELVPDFIALRGDPSDGLPGAKGVGPKTAAELLRRHGSLEQVLDNAIREPRPKLRGALIDAREDLLAFKDIATLRDAGVDPPAGPADRLGLSRRRRPRARHEPPRRAPRAAARPTERSRLLPGQHQRWLSGAPGSGSRSGSRRPTRCAGCRAPGCRRRPSGSAPGGACSRRRRSCCGW